MGGLVSGHPQVEDRNLTLEIQQCLCTLSGMWRQVGGGHRQHHVVLPRSGEAVDDLGEAAGPR